MEHARHRCRQVDLLGNCCNLTQAQSGRHSKQKYDKMQQDATHTLQDNSRVSVTLDTLFKNCFPIALTISSFSRRMLWSLRAHMVSRMLKVISILKAVSRTYKQQ